MSSASNHWLETGPWRMGFAWRADRYVHEIWHLGGDGWHLAMTSVEGSTIDDWPASPPFQSLHIENRTEGAVALLVGMAGKSHWSASAQIDPRMRCVRFDVACRVRTSQTGQLGSTYRIATDGRQRATLALAQPTESTIVEYEGELARIVIAPDNDCEARTIRWEYQVRLAEKS